MQTNADRHWFLMSYPGGRKLLFHIIILKVSIALYTFSGEKYKSFGSESQMQIFGGRERGSFMYFIKIIFVLNLI